MNDKIMRGVVFRLLTAHQNSTFKNTCRLMISLVEFCKNLPGEIFDASGSWINCLVNMLIYHHYLFQL